MLSLVLIILGSLVLAVMAVAAHSLAYFPGDVTVSHAVQAYQSEGLDTALRDVSWTGFPPQSNVVFGLVVILVLVVWSRWAAVAEALAAIGSGGLYLLLQLVVGQPRPTADLVRVDAPVQLSAFPSGHLTTFTAVFGFLAFLAWRRLSPGAARWLPIMLVVALLALMSFARISSGQHWPSDVLGGLLLGAVWLTVVIRLYLWREGRQQRTDISDSGRTLGHARGAGPARARSG
ncbi:MAG: phosphatase PAP2 family protein [Chloroflexota bacterium]